jgi:serine/threonine-protein kinase
MAPEQAAGERVDERADLYALALVLYEALAGTNPVRAGSPAATARRVGSAVPSLRRHRRDLPAELCAALNTALAPDPAARGTLDELAAALAGALPTVSDEGGTIAPHPLERTARPLPPPGRVAAAVAAAALVALALAAARDPPRWAEGADGAEVAISPLTGALVAAVLVALFPRAGWLVAAAGCAAVLAGPWPDAAVLVALAVVVPPLLLRRRGLVWSLPAAAPALGAPGLAGAYPAVAGAVRGPWARAALGAAGLWWVLLAEPLLGRDLALGTAPAGAGDALEAIATSGALLLAPLWAAAALVLPWVVRGRALAVDVAGAATWAAALAAASAAIANRAGLHEPRGLAAGAAVAGLLAVIGGRARNKLNSDDDAA